MQSRFQKSQTYQRHQHHRADPKTPEFPPANADGGRIAFLPNFFHAWLLTARYFCDKNTATTSHFIFSAGKALTPASELVRLRKVPCEQMVVSSSLAPSENRSQLVTDAVDGEQVFRFAAVVTEFFAKLHDDLVQRAGGAVIIVAPDFVQQFVARQNFAGVGMENLQQLQFLGREFFDGFAALYLKGFRINRRGTNLERMFIGRRRRGVAAIAPEQRSEGAPGEGPRGGGAPWAGGPGGGRPQLSAPPKRLRHIIARAKVEADD